MKCAVPSGAERTRFRRSYFRNDSDESGRVASAIGVFLLLSSGCLGSPAPPNSQPTQAATNVTAEETAVTAVAATRTTTGTGTSSTAGATTSEADATPPVAKGGALDATLAGYLDAPNRSAYADAHGLEVQNGRVEVVVELRSGRSLPTGNATVVATHDDRVQVYVEPDALRALAVHANVTAVRTPIRPDADSPTGDSDE